VIKNAHWYRFGTNWSEYSSKFTVNNGTESAPFASIGLVLNPLLADQSIGTDSVSFVRQLAHPLNPIGTDSEPMIKKF
jgi:hypothetical protein